MKRTGDQVGPYRVLGEMPQSSSELYVVSADDSTQIQVLKIFERVHDPERVCQQLLSSMGRVDHPSLARLHHAFIAEGRPCAVMEYVEGESLANVIHTAAADVDCTLGVAVAIEIAEALACLLEISPKQSVFHGDLCPQHVIIGFDGGVRLVETGLAVAESRATGRARGHFGYMAPERASARETDACGDVYSLGLILWELIAGSPANNGKTDSELRAWAMKPRIRPLPVKGRVNEAVSATITRALAFDRRQRPSLKDWASQLREEKSFRLHFLRRADQLQKLMARHFEHRARARLRMIDRWREDAQRATVDLAIVARPSRSASLRDAVTATTSGVPAEPGCRSWPRSACTPGRRISSLLPRGPAREVARAPRAPEVGASMSAALKTARAEPSLPPVSLWADADLASTEDLTAPAAPRLPKAKRPLSFLGGLALICTGTLLLLASTLFWGPDSRSFALREGDALQAAVDRAARAWLEEAAR